MEKIESFKIDHLNLYSGLYVSRLDFYNSQAVTTFDLRFVAPYKETPLEIPAMHTLEHLGATFFRNSNISDKVIYFGPMGCRTGFYLVLFNKWESIDIFPLVLEFLDFVISFDGEVPGATKIECGNYLEQDLITAKIYAKAYKNSLVKNKRLKY